MQALGKPSLQNLGLWRAVDDRRRVGARAGTPCLQKAALHGVDQEAMPMSVASWLGMFDVRVVAAQEYFYRATGGAGGQGDLGRGILGGDPRKAEHQVGQEQRAVFLAAPTPMVQVVIVEGLNGHTSSLQATAM